MPITHLVHLGLHAVAGRLKINWAKYSCDDLAQSLRGRRCRTSDNANLEGPQAYARSMGKLSIEQTAQ